MTKSHPEFNDRLRQVLMVLLLLTLFVVFLTRLSFLIPGFLGAVTLYIFCRNRYVKLTEERQWKKGLTAALFLVVFTLCIGIPIYFSAYMLVPRIKGFFTDAADMIQKVQALSASIQTYTGLELLTPESSKALIYQLENMVPALLNNSTIVLENFIFILFLGYFMLTEHEKMEQAINGFIPFKRSNIELLGKETTNLVKANAIGIPLISFIQGFFATLGYWIFGVDDFVFWGFLTGVFAFFPIVGTSLIWIPITINLFISHPGWQAAGLLIYGIVIIGNVDYLARITILKRIGHVHPVTTILGVILGLRLFGFWGFIFGPLLISYLLLLLKIYTSEFGTMYHKDRA